MRTGNSRPPQGRYDEAAAAGLLPSADRSSGGLGYRREPQQRAAQPARARDHRRQTRSGATPAGHRARTAAASSSSPRTMRTRGPSAVNDVRLALGTMLEIGPTGPTGCPHEHPMAGHLDVYQWLTVLQEYLVLGLMGGRCASDHELPSPTSAASGSATTTARPRRDAGLGLGQRHHRRADPAGNRRRGRRAAAGRRARRETDLLDPANCVRHVDAVVLTGGSAYGLAAADGVMTLARGARPRRRDGRRRWCRSCPRAVIFDLPVGGWQCRPTAEFGYAAAAGGRHRRRGSAPSAPVSARAPGCSRAAWARRRSRSTTSASPSARSSSSTRPATSSTPPPGCRGWPTRSRSSGWSPRPPTRWPPTPTGTASSARSTPRIAVVATDAALSPAACRRVAIAAQDGLARTIRPCHTPLDGDTVFALATGAVEVDPDPRIPASMSPEVPLITAVGAAAADVLARAVLVGVLAAESIAGIPTYRGLLPGAFE